MVKIKKFGDLNEDFYYNDDIDIDVLQEVIDGMKPTKTSDGEEFKMLLKKLNDEYPCKQQKRLSATLGKQVAWWVDLYLVQDVIDRMNPVLNPDSEKYKEALKDFLS